MDPPISRFGDYEDDIILMVVEKGIDCDVERDEPVVEIVEEVSGVPSRSECQRWGLVLDLTRWAYWARDKIHFFDSGHHGVLLLSWIGPDLLHHRWAGWACYEECGGGGVQHRWTVDLADVVRTMGPVAHNSSVLVGRI